MRAIAKVPTKYSESLTVLVDDERKEVILRDAFGQGHRLTPYTATVLADALDNAVVALL